jgi:hypothetical protein
MLFSTSPTAQLPTEVYEFNVSLCRGCSTYLCRFFLNIDATFSEYVCVCVGRGGANVSYRQLNWLRLKLQVRYYVLRPIGALDKVILWLWLLQRRSHMCIMQVSDDNH